MDGFADNFNQGEADPAAEFLAREQDALAGLEDEVPPAAVSAQGSQQLEENGSNNEFGSEGFEVINNEIEQQDHNGLNGAEDDFRSGLEYDRETAQPREEPEKIKKWREEQKARLEEKDREEEKKKIELREQAKKELEDWYKHHEETISKTKSSNRESAKNAEKQFVADVDAIEPGTEWERIAKLCDFNPKTNKSNKDVSRMRSIILQLKQNPSQLSKKI